MRTNVFIVEDQSFMLLKQRHFDTLVALRTFRKSDVPLPPRDDERELTARLIHDFEQEGWRIMFNESGDINRVALTNRRLPSGQGLAMFQAIAPFVRRGSVLHVAFIASGGYDETTWSWRFTGSECVEEPHIIPEDLDDED